MFSFQVKQYHVVSAEWQHVVGLLFRACCRGVILNVPRRPYRCDWLQPGTVCWPDGFTAASENNVVSGRVEMQFAFDDPISGRAWTLCLLCVPISMYTIMRRFIYLCVYLVNFVTFPEGLGTRVVNKLQPSLALLRTERYVLTCLTAIVHHMTAT